MGFFYQALKKAAGLPPEMQEENALQTEAALDAELREVGSAVVPPKAKPHRKLDLKFPMENLVAFLAPPIEEENVVAMEQCRILRTRIWETMRTRKMQTLLVTSAMPAEGKTLLAVNLAVALSHIENVRVLLVDVDLRRPSVARFLGLLPDKGLNSYITSGASFDDVCWTLSDSLDMVPTQPVEDNSAELLHSSNMVGFLQEVKERYDVILLDGPPLFPIVDAQVLAPLVDAAVLVVRAGMTPFDLSRQAADLLKTKFIGSILNGAEHNKKSGYYSSYYSRYGGKPAKKKVTEKSTT